MYFVKVCTKLFLSFIMLLRLCFFIPRAPSQRSWMSQVFIAMNITRGMPWFRREKDPGCAQFGSQFLNDSWVSQVNLFRRPSRLVCGGQSQSCGETESRLAGSLATKYLKIVSILYFRENADDRSRIHLLASLISFLKVSNRLGTGASLRLPKDGCTMLHPASKIRVQAQYQKCITYCFAISLCGWFTLVLLSRMKFHQD